MLISSGHERNESILDLPESTDEHRGSSDIEFELSKHQRKNSHMQNDVSGVLACLLHRFADKSRLMPRKTSWPVTVAIQVAMYQVNRLTSKQQGTGPAATSRHPTITKWSRATHLILKRRKTGGEIINRSL
jgi:hypothetical protein